MCEGARRPVVRCARESCGAPLRPWPVEEIRVAVESKLERKWRPQLGARVCSPHNSAELRGASCGIVSFSLKVLEEAPTTRATTQKNAVFRLCFSEPHCISDGYT